MVFSIPALLVSLAVAFANQPAREGARLLGRSVDGRPVLAVERGNPTSSRKVLVVGCVHGNECAGIAIVERLEAAPPPTRGDLWLIENANPDGSAAGTRQNADGVDLNRNFPWRWRRLGAPGNPYYSGPRSLSEPESRILADFIGQLRPEISIWFHQHLDLVDESGGNVAIERWFARLVGDPLRRLTRYPGSATGWENRSFPGTTAFVAELPGGQLSAEEATRYADAVIALAGR